MTMANDSAIVVDQSVPAAFVRRFGGWSAMAQNFPIFSPIWFRYRALSFLMPLALLGVILIAIALVSSEIPTGEQPYLLFVEIGMTWLSYAILLLLGRWLAVLVRSRNWPERKEAVGIVCGILLGAAVAASFNELGPTLTRRASSANVHVVARSGPGATGVTSTVRAIGPNNQTFDLSNPQQLETDNARLIRKLMWLVFVVWWGGLLDVIAYFHQRDALLEAIQQHELAEEHVARNQAELRLSVLAAQIEPHFLFNTLTGVRTALTLDPARSIVIIDHLIDYLRATIPQMRNDGGQSYALLGTQLHAAGAYLGVMRARLPRLSYTVSCDPLLEEAWIPSLMLITLVENAVKHGVEPKKGLAHIDVLAKKVGSEAGAHLELCVSDNGVGFGGATLGSGIGLSNIRERLIQLYGKRAELILKARAEGGVLAMISLPMT